MSKQKESALVNKIRRSLEVKHSPSWITKIHGGQYQQAGIPDLICCIKGVFVGLEVKLPGKEDTLTQLQQKTIDEIRGAGGIAEVVTSVEQAEEIVGRL